MTDPMTPTEHKPELPAEVREAVFNAYQRWFESTERIRIQEAVCAALAPLWPKPAPAPSDAEVAAAVERLKAAKTLGQIHNLNKWMLEPSAVVEPSDLRTVLAALAEAQRDKERQMSTQNNEPSGLGGLSFDWFAGIALLITVLIPAVLYFTK